MGELIGTGLPGRQQQLHSLVRSYVAEIEHIRSLLIDLLQLLLGQRQYLGSVVYDAHLLPAGNGNRRQSAIVVQDDTVGQLQTTFFKPAEEPVLLVRAWVVQCQNCGNTGLPRLL